MCDMQKILIIAPHQDDETLAAGCSIYDHHLKGDDVTVVFLTDGSFLPFGNATASGRGAFWPVSDKVTDRYVELREFEALKALSVLGVDEQKVIFFKKPDTRLSHYVIECVQKLLSIMEENKFDILYFPSEFDFHPDHRAGYRISTLVVMKSLERTTDPTASVRVRKYTIWNPRAVEQTGMLTRTFPAEVAKRKSQAMQIYRSQYTEFFRKFETNLEEFVAIKVSCESKRL